MAACVFDSPLYAQLFPTGEAGRLFSDSAALRAMVLVEGALAKAQGQAGVIPEISAAAIHRATLEIQIDPGAIAKATGHNGVCVPGLVAALRSEMNAPEHAQYLHWGATSQDIIDTGLMLRLRQTLALAEADLKDLLTGLAAAAEAHADTPMPARTYGQHATPTTWGAVVAQWGHPLLDALQALPRLRENSLWVSLSGAAGTASALGDQAPALRTTLADGLGLHDPKRNWHTDRSPLLRICDWMTEITVPLGAMGSTCIALSGSDIGEIRFDQVGSSSTMPQKQNPVTASALVALAQQNAMLRGGLNMAAMHQHQRDGAVWFTEWMLLPQIALTTAAALQAAKALSSATAPQPEQMRRALEHGLGLIHAEALSFALCTRMSRPDAQAVTKTLCQQALAENKPLSHLARAAYPTLPQSLFDAPAQVGQAPREARDFAAWVKAL